jgi:hypothetical protein
MGYILKRNTLWIIWVEYIEHTFNMIMEESLKFMGNSFNVSRLLEHDIVPPKTNVFA